MESVEVPGSPSRYQAEEILRKAFSMSAYSKKKQRMRMEMSPQDAALAIQMTFRAFLIRRSQALRALRELAIAKAKLKELRAEFKYFSYRCQLGPDAAGRQRFSEKIMVLLLTIESIEGDDVMVRVATRSMGDELKAMLVVVDPREPRGGRSVDPKVPRGGLSLARTRLNFSMQDDTIAKELAAGVAEVVRMLNQEDSS